MVQTFLQLLKAKGQHYIMLHHMGMLALSGMLHDRSFFKKAALQSMLTA
jgi:hypothetical protein